jgi:UDP-N-acetylglucosamine transferase subunit ALG13
VIFATVGSHPSFRFDRFLRALETLPGDDLVVQHGPGTPPANAHQAVPWMSFPEVLDHMNRAEKVVSHAGTGTILCATRAGHTPVVVPRLHRFEETVDDHQLDLARALAETGRIVVVEELDRLAAAVASTPPRGAAESNAGRGLVDAVRQELLDASR